MHVIVGIVVFVFVLCVLYLSHQKWYQPHIKHQKQGSSECLQGMWLVLSSLFCMALLQGKCDEALVLYATGNVNLWTPFSVTMGYGELLQVVTTHRSSNFLLKAVFIISFDWYLLMCSLTSICFVVHFSKYEISFLQVSYSLCCPRRKIKYSKVGWT